VILLVSNGFGRVSGRILNEVGQLIPNAVAQIGIRAVKADSGGNYVLPKTSGGNLFISATNPVSSQRDSTTVGVRRDEDANGADILSRFF